MEFEVIGWPEDRPTLDLDHRSFSYAGKFVMSNSGKAVLREHDSIIAAASFNEDRSASDRMWIRYVTVRGDHQGNAIGSHLVWTVSQRLLDRGFKAVNIAVNNPFAFQAFHRAGFGYTGEQTGIAELVLSTAEAEHARYRNGLLVFRDRADLSEPEYAFIDQHLVDGPPEPLESVE